jgi:cell wall-associated NlpC family hydrolase
LSLDRVQWINRRLRRLTICAVAVISILGCLVAANAHADPSDEAMAKLNELSRQAEQTTEEMHTAQVDLEKKLAAQKTAEERHAADQAEADAASSQRDSYQGTVDKLAAASYMGGYTDPLSAMMTADSPQQLIEQLSAQQAVATMAANQMTDYRKLSERATAAEAASAKSAGDARAAAEQAAAARADIQSKQSRLQVQIAVVKSQYQALSPAQQMALAAPGPMPGPAPGPMPGPAPEAVPPADDMVEAMPDMLLTPPPEGAVPAPHIAGGEGAIVVQAALSRIGSPYSWGAAGPNAFDCSGLVMWAFQQAGISLPHSSQALAQGGRPVGLAEMEPGDVITYYGDASHAAIYIGDGMMVHSSTYGRPVQVAPVGNAPIYNVRRY